MESCKLDAESTDRALFAALDAATNVRPMEKLGTTASVLLYKKPRL